MDRIVGIVKVNFLRVKIFRSTPIIFINMKLTFARTFVLVQLLCLYNTFLGFAQNDISSLELFSENKCQSVTDYSVIKKGETGCISENVTLTYLTLDGGKLVIKGKVRVNNLAINKGEIIITKTGSALLPAMTFSGDVKLTNFGSVTYMGNVVLNNSNNSIKNSVSSSMYWGSSELNFRSRNSILVNYGTISVGTLRLDSKNGQVILGPNSLTNVTNLVNTYDNRILIPIGSARLSLTGYAQLSESLTSSSNLIICPGPAAEIKNLSDQADGFGKATVMEKGCTLSLIRP